MCVNVLENKNPLDLMERCVDVQAVCCHGSVSRHQALEFFKPGEDNVDLALHLSFHDHQELLAVWGDVIIDL